MFIFGFGRRTYKVLGETEPKKCKNCSHERPFKYVHEKRWFSFFSIPLFVYKQRKILVCSVCGAGFEATGEVKFTELTVKTSEEKKKDKETIIESIKEKFDNGEISKNEYIRMCNVLNFETQH